MDLLEQYCYDKYEVDNALPPQVNTFDQYRKEVKNVHASFKHQLVFNFTFKKKNQKFSLVYLNDLSPEIKKKPIKFLDKYLGSNSVFAKRNLAHFIRGDYMFMTFDDRQEIEFDFKRTLKFLNTKSTTSHYFLNNLSTINYGFDNFDQLENISVSDSSDVEEEIKTSSRVKKIQKRKKGKKMRG